MKKLFVSTLMIFVSLATQAALAETPAYVGIYNGTDLNNQPCTVEVETFRMSTYRPGMVNRDITVTFNEVKMKGLYFEAIIDGKGTMKQNSLFQDPWSKDRATWIYSHFAPNALIRRERGLIYRHVLRTAATIDLNETKALVLYAGQGQLACQNLQKQ